MKEINNDLDIYVTRRCSEKTIRYLPYIQRPDWGGSWDETYMQNRDDNWIPYAPIWDSNNNGDWEDFINQELDIYGTYNYNRNNLDNTKVVPVKMNTGSSGEAYKNDSFEVTIYCRQLISSWQTFSVVVDYYENPIYSEYNENNFIRSNFGLQCEVPDNNYLEHVSDVPAYPAPTPTENQELNNCPYDNQGNRVGQIFHTDFNGDLSGPGVNITSTNEIYFKDLISEKYAGEQKVEFINKGNIVAIITKDGNLFLKGKIIGLGNPILENDKEEILSVNHDIQCPGLPNWIISPVPEPTPSSIIPDNDHKEWIVKYNDGTNNQVVALLDLESGDLRLMGKVLIMQNEINLSNRKFAVKSKSSGSSEIVFAIDQDGNMYLKGTYFENSF